MDDVATKIIDILKKHMKEPRNDIGLDTALTDLKIESLDLAMIVFDIEDTFGIEIPYNANEEAADFKTVGSVVERVKALIESAQTAEAAEKTSIVTQLSERGVHTKDELEKMPLEGLRTLAAYGNVTVPDFSGRALPRDPNSRQLKNNASYAAPDPYKAALEARRKETVN